MLDTLLNIGCAFNWITPAAAFAQDFCNGPVSDFGIPANAGWDRGDIKQLLTRHGVHVWGLMYNLDGDMLMFTVKNPQAWWTHYLLQREGVPILYAPAEIVNSTPHPKKTGVTNPLESFLDSLDHFLDFLDKV